MGPPIDIIKATNSDQTTIMTHILKKAFLKKDRIIFLLLLIILSSCSNKTEESKYLQETQVFVSKISWDTNKMETFGSGQIFFFNPNHEVKIFSNSFLKNKDSLAWGEPGIILKIGKWKLESEKVICKTQIIHRTFKIDRKEQIEVDTFYFENRLLKDKTMIYKPNPLITKELSQFIRMDWEKFKDK